MTFRALFERSELPRKPGPLTLAILLAGAGGVLSTRAEVTMEKTTYGGWPNCIRLSNGKLELVATTDVGPRVIRLAPAGGKNLFKEWPDQLGKTGGEEWRIYGGHRLWHAPEVRPRSYAPDNEPVKMNWDGRRLTLTQPVEKLTGIQKEIEITLATDEPEATVVHRLINRGLWAIEAAPWALSVCQGPGRAIVPQEPPIPHSEKVLPARTLTLWGYTDMQDPRYTWGTKFVQVRSDPSVQRSQKVGFMNSPGWAAFERDGVVFLKRFAFDPRATYADFGCNTEVYTSGDMLELETLGPLSKIEPGNRAEHVERWYVFEVRPGDAEPELEAALAPLLSRTQPVKP